MPRIKINPGECFYFFIFSLSCFSILSLYLSVSVSVSCFFNNYLSCNDDASLIIILIAVMMVSSNLFYSMAAIFIFLVSLCKRESDTILSRELLCDLNST